MIMINNQWETVKTIDDVKRIVEEYLGTELANKISEFQTEHTDEEFDELESKIEDLESDNGILEDENISLDNQNDNLQDCIETLKEFMYDVNPTEIASHIEHGDLEQWCNSWRNAVEKVL